MTSDRKSPKAEVESPETPKGARETAPEQVSSGEDAEALRVSIDNLEQKYRLREEHFKRIEETNSILVSQAKEKWSRLNMFTGLIATVMTINFGYQIFQSVDITKELGEAKRTHKKMKDSASKIDADHKKLKSQRNQGVKSLLAIYQILASVDVIRTNEKDGYAQNALSKALKSQRKLEELLGSFTGKTKEDDQYRRITKKLIVDHILKRLRILWRSAEKRNAELFIRILTESKRASTIDPTNHRVFHFIGLAEAGLNPKSRNALKAFEKSVKLSPALNVDLINIAEVHFVRTDYQNAERIAKQYLDQAKGKLNTRTLAAMLIRALSAYMKENGTIEHLRKLKESVDEKVISKKMLESSFDPTALKLWRKPKAVTAANVEDFKVIDGLLRHFGVEKDVAKKK